jgi:hypothetical protein
MQVWTFWEERKATDYEVGLSNLGIPPDEIVRISQGLVVGRLPRDVLDVVITNEANVGKLHPDRYPWENWGSDTITTGLADKRINSRAVWQDATTYVKRRFGRGMPCICDVSAGCEQALTNLFEVYALAKYHDVGKLQTASSGLLSILRGASPSKSKTAIS